jgi:N-acetylglucosamine-6-phosphate deacetylase
VLFNAEPTPEAIRAIAAAHARHGTTALLPTYITDRPEGMGRAMAAAREALRAGVPGLAGLHLEGPFLSVARKGAHDPALIRPMEEADLQAILGCGVRPLLLTVAAETVTPEQIGRLAAGGVTVSLGHTDASYEAAARAAEAGARGVTHLFNAMSGLAGRTPGVIGAALDHGGLWVGMIADGFHAHPASLRAALRGKRGPGRLFLVSDAMPTAAGGGDTFELNGRRVVRAAGRLTLQDGTLAGSDITMADALRFTVRELGVDLAEALRMAALYPATLLGLDQGRLAPGAPADMVHLDEALGVEAVWIAGQAMRGIGRPG